MEEREDIFSKFKDSPLFNKPESKKHFILRVMHLLCRPVVIWEWDDFGIMLRVFRNSEMMDYYMSIDIQIAWCNLWIQFFKKKNL